MRILVVTMVVFGLSSNALAEATPERAVDAAFEEAQAAFDRSDFDEALKALARAAQASDATAEERAAAWDSQAGILFLEKHDVDAAVSAMNRSISLFPDGWRRLQYRGAYRTTTGDPELAIRDLDKAVALSPDVWSTHGARGLALLGLGRFDAAARDLERALQIESGRPYVALALHVARIRAGKDDRAEFSAYTARFGSDAWPGPIFAFYAGDLTAEALLQAALVGPHAEADGHLCEANYYIAEAAMAAGDAAGARDMFQTAIAVCGFSFSERGGALSELKRLP